MESTSFYITLPSNASMDYYSNNTPSCYQIHLPRTFYLQGKYEVALAEIQYPHTWPSMKSGLEYYVCTREMGEEDYRCARIPHGYYQSVQQLCDEITARIAEREQRPGLIKLYYHEVTRRVYMESTEHYEVAYTPNIC